MLRIRLQRVGRKHEPAFRLVLTDSKNSTKSGRFKEILGSYDPRKETDVIDAERVNYWISQGAQPTDTVHNLLIKHGVIEGKKRNVLPKKTPQIKEDPKEEAPKEEAPAESEKTAEDAQDISTEENQEEKTAEEATPAESVKEEVSEESSE